MLRSKFRRSRRAEIPGDRSDQRCPVDGLHQNSRPVYRAAVWEIELHLFHEVNLGTGRPEHLGRRLVIGQGAIVSKAGVNGAKRISLLHRPALHLHFQRLSCRRTADVLSSLSSKRNP